MPIQLLPKKDSSSESIKYDGIISPTKMFWTTANYSFFIRPGMKRIDVKPTHKVSDLEAATSLMVSSYTDNKEVVTVIVNYTDKEEKLELKCDKAKTGKLYVTSIDKNLEYAGEHALKKLAIPARSVVTVVVKF